MSPQPEQQVFGASPFPSWLDDFHGSIQHHAADRMGWEVLAAATLAAILTVVVRRARSVQASDAATDP